MLGLIQKRSIVPNWRLVWVWIRISVNVSIWILLIHIIIIFSILIVSWISSDSLVWLWWLPELPWFSALSIDISAIWSFWNIIFFFLLVFSSGWSLHFPKLFGYLAWLSLFIPGISKVETNLPLFILKNWLRYIIINQLTFVFLVYEALLVKTVLLFIMFFEDPIVHDWGIFRTVKHLL